MVYHEIIQTIETTNQLEENWKEIEEDWNLQNISDFLSFGTINTTQNEIKQLKELHNLYEQVYEQRRGNNPARKYKKTEELLPSFKELYRTIDSFTQPNPDQIEQKLKVGHYRDILIRNQITEKENYLHIEDLDNNTQLEYEGPTDPSELKNYK